MYACTGKGRERNRGDWKNEKGCVHHRASVSAGGGAFRRPRLRDGYGERPDARRARARVQPRCDFFIRARYAHARAADCDNRANSSANADCHIRAIRRANIRARYAHAHARAIPSACADCYIRAKYTRARADCYNRARDNIRARYADTRADCHNSAYRRADARAYSANIRARYAHALAINDNRARRDAGSPDRHIRARADSDLHADARAHRYPDSPDADARAHVNADSPDLHARAAARRQRQSGQRRRRARARFHAQFRGWLIAHHRESAG